MKSADWRTALPRRADNRAVASWLTEPGSLTARCQAASRHFRVRVIGHGLGAALPDEAALIGVGRGRARVREVVLECDGVPVIFAHTVLPAAQRGHLPRWLARLGSRSLGSLLFAYPGFRRGPIEFRRLDARHPLYRRAAAFAPAAGRPLWARRSLHRLGGRQVLVTEVFLPAIAGLAS